MVLPSSSNPTTTRESGATSHRSDMTPSTNPVHSGSSPTDDSPTGDVVVAPPDITSTATLSHPLEGSEEQDPDMVIPSPEPRTNQILSTAFTHAPEPTHAPMPTSLPNTPLESYDAGIASASNSSHFAPPYIGSSISASRPTSSTTLPHLRARGLVNTGNLCFANAVFQVLVNTPPLWNLFKELDDLKRQRVRGTGVSETGGGATPLVDATVRLFKEFVVEEERQSQQAISGTSRAGEEKKDNTIADPFEPTYMYDAMKEKTQLKSLLVRSSAHVTTSVTDLCLPTA